MQYMILNSSIRKTAFSFAATAVGLSLLLAPGAFAKPIPIVPHRHVLAEGEKVLVNVDKNGLAIKGFDPVAYVEQNKAVKGNAKFSLKTPHATYHFASEENKALFEKSPEKYTPAFGGYCGYGVADNHLAPIDPTVFQIVDGKLILQYNRDAMALFNKDVKANMAKAEANWKELVQKEGK